MDNSLILLALAGVLGGYLVGGIPFGLLIGFLNGVDVRKIGSGNIGATNVGRALGKGWWLVVFGLDALKGFGPTLAMRQALLAVVGENALDQTVPALVWMCSGVMAILGHNYPIYLKFKGGKGVSTSLGVALAIYPDFTIPALIGLAVWILVIALTKISSVGSILGALSLPLAYVVISLRGEFSWSTRWPYVAFITLVVGMLVYRHKANIVLLAGGRERLMGKVDQHGEPAGTSSADKPV